jgi:hypothetical protein
MNDYGKYLSGRRVCLIGASGRLVETVQTDLINSYDIVVRVNSGFPVSDKIAPFTGPRCDVLYVGANAMTAWLREPELFSLARKSGVRWINSVRCTIGNDRDKKFHSYRKLVGTRTTGREFEGKIKGMIKTLPTSGYLALIDLLGFDIVELYITGYDFYESGYFEGYHDKRRVSGGKRPHDSDKQKRHFVRLCGKDRRIKTDAVLTEIINRGNDEGKNRG